MKLKTNVEGSKGEQLKVGLPAAVKENRSNIFWLAKTSTAKHTALSSLHDELCAVSAIDQFW